MNVREVVKRLMMSILLFVSLEAVAWMADYAPKFSWQCDLSVDGLWT